MLRRRAYCQMLSSAVKKLAAGAAPCRVVQDSAPLRLSQGKLKSVGPFSGLELKPSVSHTFASKAYQTDAAEAGQQQASAIPVVPWARDLVSLSGNLGQNVEITQIPNGAEVSNFRIALYGGKNKDPIWLDVEAWDDVAIASQELRKGEKVNVVGRLVAKKGKTREGVEFDTVRVRADIINRVQSLQRDPSDTGSQYNSESQLNPGYADETGPQTAYDEEAPISQQIPPTKAIRPGKDPQNWRHLIDNFNEYWDNRFTKKNPRGPDFKHKTTQVALWMNDAPPELQIQIENLIPSNKDSPY